MKRLLLFLSLLLAMPALAADSVSTDFGSRNIRGSVVIGPTNATTAYEEGYGFAPSVYIGTPWTNLNYDLQFEFGGGSKGVVIVKTNAGSALTVVTEDPNSENAGLTVVDGFTDDGTCLQHNSFFVQQFHYGPLSYASPSQITAANFLEVVQAATNGPLNLAVGIIGSIISYDVSGANGQVSAVSNSASFYSLQPNSQYGLGTYFGKHFGFWSSKSHAFDSIGVNPPPYPVSKIAGGLYVEDLHLEGTNTYGVYMEDQGTGANNWSIYSEGGKGYHGGAFTFGGAVTSTSASTNAPADNEFITKRYHMEHTASSFVGYNSTNLFNQLGYTNSVYGQTPFLFINTIPAQFGRVYTGVTANQYVGVVALTNQTQISGTYGSSVYLGYPSGGGNAVSVKMELYYSYGTNGYGTNVLLGDWESEAKAITAGQTNRYDFTVNPPITTSTGGTFVIYRTLKVTSQTSTPNLAIMGGTNTPSQFSYNAPVSSISLDGSQITSGTVAAARLPASAVQINADGGITNARVMANGFSWTNGSPAIIAGTFTQCVINLATQAVYRSMILTTNLGITNAFGGPGAMTLTLYPSGADRAVSWPTNWYVTTACTNLALATGGATSVRQAVVSNGCVALLTMMCCTNTAMGEPDYLQTNIMANWSLLVKP